MYPVDGHLITVYYDRASTQAFVSKPPLGCFTLVEQIRMDLICKQRFCQEKVIECKAQNHEFNLKKVLEKLSAS